MGAKCVGGLRANDGGSYKVAQSGLLVTWEAASGDGGKSRTHGFSGAFQGDAIVCRWEDLRTRHGGDLSVLVIDSNRFDKVPRTGEGFGGDVWTC